MHIAEALISFEQTWILVLNFCNWLSGRYQKNCSKSLCFLSELIASLWNQLVNKLHVTVCKTKHKWGCLGYREYVCLLAWLWFFSPSFCRGQRNLHLQLKVQVCSTCMVVWENTKFQKQCMTSKENLEVAFYFLVMQPQSHFEVTSHTLYILLLLYIFKILMKPALEAF